MPVIANNAAEHPLLDLLQFAMQGFAKSIGEQVNAILRKHGKPVPKVLEKQVADAMPTIVQQAFVTELLADGKKPRKARVLLAHVVSNAEMQNDSALRDLLRNEVPQAFVMASEDEVTSEEAAKLLFASRTHVNKLVKDGLLGDVRTTAGGHRRITRAAVMAYRAAMKTQQAKGLGKMMEASARMGAYDEEMAALPKRRNR